MLVIDENISIAFNHISRLGFSDFESPKGFQQISIDVEVLHPFHADNITYIIDYSDSKLHRDRRLFLKDFLHSLAFCGQSDNDSVGFYNGMRISYDEIYNIDLIRSDGGFRNINISYKTPNYYSTHKLVNIGASDSTFKDVIKYLTEHI